MKTKFLFEISRFKSKNAENLLTIYLPFQRLISRLLEKNYTSKVQETIKMQLMDYDTYTSKSTYYPYLEEA